MESNDFADLKQIVSEAGLLKKQPGYYIMKTLLTFSLVALGIIPWIVTDNTWIWILDAVFMAFVFVQLGLLGHDAGHRQIAETARRNDMIGLIVSFLLGLSRSWWVDQHNEHHVNPNDLDVDPHTFIPIVAFSEEQALGKKGIARFLVRYQAFYFFPMFMLEGLGIRLASIRFIMKGENVKFPVLEPILMAAHFVAYLGMVFYFMDVWQAIVFIVVHQLLFGLYLGSVFAPNHKGMALMDKDWDFLRRQVLTSRNVKAHPFTDFVYGGLNFQIEHHLFPSMPRNNLKKAQRIVRTFCADRGVPYHETTLAGSYKEILFSMHEVSAPLRNKAASAA